MFTVQRSLLHYADAELMAESFVGVRHIKLLQSVRLRLIQVEILTCT